MYRICFSCIDLISSWVAFDEMSVMIILLKGFSGRFSRDESERL